MPISRDKDIEKCYESYQMSKKDFTGNNENISKYEAIRYNNIKEQEAM